MTAGFGVEKAADGSGTTSGDIRKIFGGLYTPGLISGCLVTQSATDMTYVVSAGVVAIKTATDEIILAPVATTTVPTAAAPGSGTRTDYIYAKQDYPSVEGDANIVLGVGTSLPSRAVLIKKFIVSSGNTKTSQAVATGSIDYSIPYGASLGVLHKFQDTTVGTLPTALTRKGSGTISLPTDRRLKFSLTTTIQANNAVGFDNSKYCEWGFLPNIDGGDFILWATPGLHQSLSTLYFEGYFNATAGTHTVNYGAVRISGPGTAYHYYGTLGGYGRVGTIFQVEDAGPTK